MEVSQLSRTIAKVLGLNEDLVEAISLGHDLGHTPFGHAGESVLNEILSGKDTLDGILSSESYGGFKHNYQSLRVVDKIEKKYDFDGLNLTSYVREGILKHTKLKSKFYSYPDLLLENLHFDFATSIEGQVVAVCDEIAQRTHDLEDGIRAGLVEIEQVRELNIIKLVEKKFHIYPLLLKDRYIYRNAMIKGLINLFVSDIIETTLENIKIFFNRKNRMNFFDEEIVVFSKKIDPLQIELDLFIDDEIIFKNKGDKTNILSKNIIRKLFKNFIMNPTFLPSYILEKIYKDDNIKKNEMVYDSTFIRIVADYIAGMTDNFAENEINRLEKDEYRI